jgi:hypothetical protein
MFKPLKLFFMRAAHCTAFLYSGARGARPLRDKLHTTKLFPRFVNNTRRYDLYKFIIVIYFLQFVRS